MRVLANDGMHPIGVSLLEDAGFEVDLQNVPKEDLPTKLPKYEVIVIRSATKVRKELIDSCPNLKVIARAGVGMDNVDVDYARSKGIEVFNTPSASSWSVAELVIGHMLTLSRFLHLSNREMPVEGDARFKALKKSYNEGRELKGKTLGIIGYGRIGQSLARIGLALGMRILPVDLYTEEATLTVDLFTEYEMSLSRKIHTVTMDEMLAQADYISLHVPSAKSPILGTAEFDKMKDGVIVINAARGGVVDEEALLAALDSGKVAGAGLDVFENEPTPDRRLLTHPKISVSPHTGASTEEAQVNIGKTIAERLIEIYKL